MENTNLITGKYEIDRTSGTEIVITEIQTGTQCSFTDTNETTIVNDCYIARIEPFDSCNPEQAYIQYTDINGISSEVVLTKEDYDEVAQSIKLSHDYCVLKLANNIKPEDVFFAYIDLEDAFSFS